VSVKEELNIDYAEERAREIRAVLRIITNHMAIPLYLIFSIVDFIYVPHFAIEFLGIRFLMVPVSILFQRLTPGLQDYQKALKLAFALVVCYSFSINYMIWRIGDPSTPYYAGLNLIAIATLSFIPWLTTYWFYVVAFIYVPYLSFCAVKVFQQHEITGIINNLFFVVGTIAISYFIKVFNQRIRMSEFKSQEALKAEIINRDEVIALRTEESVKLRSLSNQFSPQIVDAIRAGKINLNQRAHRSKICVIFVDIVSSTERLNHLDHEDIDRVLDMFMKDVIDPMLTYDLTIDKFQGDSLLAFSNDPIKQNDFVERVALAALAAKSAIEKNREIYEIHWKRALAIKVGISVGYANVGFYGNSRFYHAYTAIGRPVPMAVRLSSAAESNQILLDYDAAKSLEAAGYKIAPRGKLELKGFEGDVYQAFELLGTPDLKKQVLSVMLCKACDTGILALKQNHRGIYVFECLNCHYVVEEFPQESMKLAA
jgi:adenylate cyclase